MQEQQLPKEKYSHIQGWGADLNPADRPAYPKERTPPRLEGLHWKNVEFQDQNIRVFHSIERPGITPVFGTSTPPRGLSGKLRQFAFKYSESDVRHWLILLLADRVNVVEGLFDDFSRGKVPNVFAEMGWKAELKHNKTGFIRKMAVLGVATGAIVYFFKRRRRLA